MGFLRRPSPHRRVEQLIRRGVGIHEASWALPAPAEVAPAELVEEIVSWVRRSMGEMRRPYGIDHVAFALACRDSSGTVLCSNSLGVIRHGASLGGVESLASLAAFTSHKMIGPEGRSRAGIPEGLVRVSAGIESIDDLWADLAQALGKAAVVRA